MSPQASPEATRFAPSSSLLVVVWPDRLELPLVTRARVGAAELRLLGELSTGRHATLRQAALAAGDSGLVELARKLAARGGLLEGSAAVEEGWPGPPPNAPSAMPGNEPLALDTPFSLRPRRGRFEYLGHDGSVLLSLSAGEVLRLPDLVRPASVAERCAARPRETLALRRLHRQLWAARLLRAVSSAPDPTGVAADEWRRRAAFARAAAHAARRESLREHLTGVRRTAVVPLSFTNGPPLALGLIFARCEQYEEGRLNERFDFRHDWEWDDERIADYTARPAVYLCSAYVWSHREILRITAQIKARSPGSLVVVGGPDAPKREAAARDYLAAHPQVDVLVRGEGEQTALELLLRLEDGLRREGKLDAAALAGLAGTTVRCGERLLRGPERERIDDLDALPSPFLSGVFDTYLEAPPTQVILETNRGCPYGCTFCDWGSATLSRVRKFALERVLAEIEWCARARARTISIADANFGVFARDVEIAQAVVGVRARTSWPQTFGANFAKNTVKHLQRIIRLLVDGGIVNRGLLSLQTMDEVTLAAVDRSNIPVEKYENIAREMRAAGLPFAVELMMGLPGSTLDSFRSDLQACIDREVEGTVNPTSVLVNSPMNAPEYLAGHGIETAVPVTAGSHALLVSTASFTRDDYEAMRRLRHAFLLCENFGMTRHLNRLVRHYSGMTEIEFIERLLARVHDRSPSDYPLLALLLAPRPYGRIPPVSWGPVVEELVALILACYPDIDNGALAVVAQVQHALLPAFDRAYPATIALAHDYPAWFSRMLALKEGGHRDDWQAHLEPLQRFGPGELVVDDPRRLARSNIGCSVDHGPLLATWEHASAVGRALFLA